MSLADSKLKSTMKSCIQDGDVAGVHALLDAGYALEEQFDSEGGAAALSFAAAYSMDEIVELLLQAGAAVDARDYKGHTALHCVTRDAGRRTMQTLLRCGADPNAQSDNGITPLHLALAMSTLAPRSIYKPEGELRLKLLLEAGADPDFRATCADPEMQDIYLTPLQGAFKRRNFEAAVMLVEASKSSPDQLTPNGFSLSDLSMNDVRFKNLQASMRAMQSVEAALAVDGGASEEGLESSSPSSRTVSPL